MAGVRVICLNALQLIGCVFLFSVCGMGIVAPLRSQIMFPIAASPFAGLLALSSASLVLHIATQTRFSTAMWIAAVGLICLSAAMYRVRPTSLFSARGFAIVTTMLTILLIASCFVYLGRENQVLSPALVFYAGSDQFGYAHMADWLNGEPRNISLTASPDRPWESWVDYMVAFDPRFGSISIVAIVSALTGRSGMFSYNFASALVVVTAAIGISGIFARTALMFITVAIGIFLSSWFTVSMAGYFGKAIGYPASLFAIGMFFALARKKDDQPLVGFLAALTIVISACISFSAVGTVVIFVLICGTLVVLIWIMARPVDNLWNNPRELAIVVLALASIGFISGGTVARPMYTLSTTLDISWWELLCRAAQVVGPDAGLSSIPLYYQKTLTLLAGTLSVMIALIAARQRNFEAIALLIGAAMLASMLMITGKRWEFQMSLTLYVPIVLCAAATLFADRQPFGYRLAALFAMIIIAAGIGRFDATLRATTSRKANPKFWASQSEMDAVLAAVSVSDGAYIDTPDVYSTYPLVLELHRKGIPFQFSPRAWKSFMGYRPWNAPKYTKLNQISVMFRDESTKSCVPDRVLCTEHYILQNTAARSALN